MKRIYLDNASTSFPKPECVISSMCNYLQYNGSNTARGESKYTFQTEEAINLAREELSSLIHFSKDSNVIFSLNITTALNTIIRSFDKAADEVLITPMEHNAVMRPLTEYGISYHILDADENGRCDPSSITKYRNSRTRAIIVQAASNVNGCTQDIASLAKAAHREGLFVVVDTAQAMPYLDFNMEKDGIDCLCFTGHKGLMGPQGTGGFIITDEMAKWITPLTSGGTGSLSSSLLMPAFMPDRFEAGTQNLPGIIGLGSALGYVREHLDEIRAKSTAVTKLLRKELNKIEGIKVYSADERIPVISIDTPERDVAEMANYLEDEDIQTRVGLHCAPMAHRHLGTMNGLLRLSPSSFTLHGEIMKAVDTIRDFIYEKQ